MSKEVVYITFGAGIGGFMGALVHPAIAGLMAFFGVFAGAALAFYESDD